MRYTGACRNWSFWCDERLRLWIDPARQADEEYVLTVTELGNIWRWREAVYRLVARNLKVRYKNSALGFFWSFLNPLMQVVVMTIAFRYIMGLQIENYSAQLFTVLLPWQFFSQAVSDGSVAVAENNPLLRKFPFPRIILPLCTLFSNLIHLLLGMTVLVVIFLALPVAILPSFAWVIVFMAIQMMFMMGLLMLVAVLRMYYDDIRFILEALLRLWFYLTPLAYNIQMVMDSERLTALQKQLYLLGNPMTPVMIGYRSALLEGGVWPIENFWFYVGVSAAVSAVVLLAGAIVWRRYEWQLPELL